MRTNQLFNVVAAGALCLGLTACDQKQQPDPTSVTENPPGTSLRIYDSEGRDRITLESPSVMVDVNFPRRAPTDTVTVELINPKGKVFHRVAQPIPAEGLVVDRMGVLGTPINDYRMTGKWRANVYYNDATTPVLTSLFEMHFEDAR